MAYFEARRRPVNLPIRLEFSCISTWTDPAVGDMVELTTASMEVQECAAATNNRWIGEVFAVSDDLSTVVVELRYMNVRTLYSQAAIAAPGQGVMYGGKVKLYVNGTDDDVAITHNMMLCNTTTGADEQVVVLW
jgi:hypothetical protein